jgi:hypothetical protein
MRDSPEATTMTTRLAVLGVTILCAVTRSVAARDSSTDSVRADELFQQGRALMRDGRQEEACPKFAESLQLDPSVGTEINLAVCLEKTGKTGSAWRAYRHAHSEASRLGQTVRAKGIAERMGNLEVRLSRLRIDLEGVRVPCSVRIDGAAVEQLEAAAGVPVDPGDHVVSVSEGQSEIFHQRVQVGEGGRVVIVRASPATESQRASDSSSSHVANRTRPVASIEEDAEFRRREQSSGVPWRTVGATAAGVGLLVGGVAAGFALVAHGKYRNALALCGNRSECSNAAGLSERREADRWDLAATGCVLGAATLLVSGGIIYFVAPAEKRIGLAIVPTQTGFSTSFHARF